MREGRRNRAGGGDTEGGDKRAQVRTNMSRFNVVRYGPDLLTCYASAKCKRRELRCTPAVVNVLTGVSLVHVAVIYSVSTVIRAACVCGYTRI